jgi:putative ABC transport system permease protein
LVSYTAFLRKREIGIRKVLGATTGQITALLSRDFLRLVVLAFVLAVPLAWWLGRRWLADYAYQIDIQWWHFAVAGAGTLLLALVTVNLQSIRAALADPVDSLRNE